MTSVKRSIMLGIGVFALIGFGLGLSGMVVVDYVQGQFVNESAGQFAQSIGQLLVVMLALGGIMTTFFTGPTVAALTSLSFTRELSSTRSAATAAGVASFVGFLAMTVIAVTIIAMSLGTGGATGGGGGDGGGGVGGAVNVGKLVMQIFAASAPTTVVGAVTAVIDRQ